MERNDSSQFGASSDRRCDPRVDAGTELLVPGNLWTTCARHGGNMRACISSTYHRTWDRRRGIYRHCELPGGTDPSPRNSAIRTLHGLVCTGLVNSPNLLPFKIEGAVKTGVVSTLRTNRVAAHFLFGKLIFPLGPVVRGHDPLVGRLDTDKWRRSPGKR